MATGATVATVATAAGNGQIIGRTGHLQELDGRCMVCVHMGKISKPLINSIEDPGGYRDLSLCFV